MALDKRKQNFKIVDAWHAEIKYHGSGKALMTITGANGNGSPMEFNIIFENYFFPHMAKDINRVLQTEVANAQRQQQSFHEAATTPAT